MIDNQIVLEALRRIEDKMDKNHQICQDEISKLREKHQTLELQFTEWKAKWGIAGAVVAVFFSALVNFALNLWR